MITPPAIEIAVNSLISTLSVGAVDISETILAIEMAIRVLNFKVKEIIPQSLEQQLASAKTELDSAKTELISVKEQLAAEDAILPGPGK